MRSKLVKRQAGVALIVFAVVLILTVSVVVITGISQNSRKLEQQRHINELLGKAKEAIAAIAISNTELPGKIPYPVRSGGGGFDGSGDCISSGAVSLNYLLGRLPTRREQGCGDVEFGLDLEQSQLPGEAMFALHYAISVNLAEHPEGSDQNLINANVVTENANWLSLWDENGQLISNRIAFIVFYPGPVIAGQDRSNPNAEATEYLDQFNVPGQGVISNAVSDLRYVRAPVSATFNDQLVYMTVDELMSRVEARVFAEMRTYLESFITPANGFPADFSAVSAAPYLEQWRTMTNQFSELTANYAPSVTFQLSSTCIAGDTSGCGVDDAGDIEWPGGSGNLYDVVVTSTVPALNTPAITLQ